MTSKLRSLRTRLLLPLLAVSLIVALAVTFASYLLGSRWAEADMAKRADGVKQVLQSANFPLTDNVLRLIAGLTRTDVSVFGPDGTALASTFDVKQLRPDAKSLFEQSSGELEGDLISIDSRNYRAFVVERQLVRNEMQSAEKIMILVDEADIRAGRWRAAILPLITGLSTTALLATLTLGVTGRLILRLSKLKSKVDRVAAGDFSSTVSDNTPDEVGDLGGAVDSMAIQLDKLWQALGRQQSEKLLHQLSAGLAHQVRNSLTGARLAIELHRRRCRALDDTSLNVVNMALEDLDEYISRLVLVGHGQLEKDRAANVSECLSRVQSRISPIAEHHHVVMDWAFDPQWTDVHVRDGHTFEAAVTNLVMNALDVAKNVQVHAGLGRLDADHCANGDVLAITIIDDGPGIAEEIAESLFEPLVTTKPEGMGIGLAHVRRAAEHLGGQVRWYRKDGKTVFELKVVVR